MPPQSSLISLSPLYLASCSATPGPFTPGMPDGMRSCSVDPLQSDFTTPLDALNRNSLNHHSLEFYHYTKPANPDFILHWYGQCRRSLQDNAEESLQHDKALLKAHIQHNSKLTSQLAFMKNGRKRKQPDGYLVEDYRFIVSLHETLKKVELKVCRIFIS
jgi:hypothetical protein